MKLSGSSSEPPTTTVFTGYMHPIHPLGASRYQRAATAAAPLAAILLIGLAGCGRGGSSSKPLAATPTTVAAAGAGQNRAALQAFRECMATNGSPLPTFAPRPRATDPATGAASGNSGAAGTAPVNGGAPDANGGPGGGSGLRGGAGIGNVATSADPAVQKAYAACKDKLPPGFTEQQQKAQQQRAAFNSCMKDHGVTLPSGAAAAGTTPSTVDRNSQAYKDAFAVCGQLLPQRPTTTSTTAGA